MDAQLLIWLVEHYSEPGQTILDPMFGSGTTMLACTLGRNVIGMELEQKFVDMAKQNWEKVQQRPQLGYAMGECTILLGDARQLPQVLCDAVITSPPYSTQLDVSDRKEIQKAAREAFATGGTFHFMDKDWTLAEWKKANWGRMDGRGVRHGNTITYGQADAIITSPPYEGSLELSSRHTKGGIPGRDAKLGQTGTYADVVISSPPYASAGAKGDENPENYIRREEERLKKFPQRPKTFVGRYSGSWDNIGNLAYGRIDAILTSPPYAEAHDKEPGGLTKTNRKDLLAYSWLKEDNPDNIGNLKANSYLAAMLTVYQNCHAVLRDGGLMVLVVKNFIRNKAEVDLRADTVKLAEQAGFTFLEEHYRKLTQQSFWRILYKRKYPDGPVIDKEYVLAFRKVLL